MGSINYDLVVYSDRLPKRGESLIGKNFGVYPGGKGANQALQVKRLQEEVIFRRSR